MQDKADLEVVIGGMAADLEALRAGRISVPDARARAELGKQIIAGFRLVLSAQKYLADNARNVGLPNRMDREAAE